jgi:riboflavin kinase/FMN adenylyltransferase
VHNIATLQTAQRPTSIALGNFDGVHLGHRQVIQSLPTKDNGAYRTVLAFNPHPQEFFSGQPRALLTPLPEKLNYLKAIGVDQLVLLPFDRTLAALSPQEFVELILIDQLQARHISVGFNFFFGHQRTGTAEDLRAIAAHFGVSVTIIEPQSLGAQPISSSVIRHALADHQLDLANRLLGRTYTLTGEVIQGDQLGRTLGFPTANLSLPPTKFLPGFGVYCVRVQMTSANGNANEWLPGVMNLGQRPTVNGKTLRAEIHLLDWSGDLYGQSLTVSLEQFLRSEQSFPSLDALQAQIHQDCHQARTLFAACLT